MMDVMLPWYSEEPGRLLVTRRAEPDMFESGFGPLRMDVISLGQTAVIMFKFQLVSDMSEKNKNQIPVLLDRFRVFLPIFTGAPNCPMNNKLLKSPRGTWRKNKKNPFKNVDGDKLC